MIKYLKERIAQPTTWIGVAAIANVAVTKDFSQLPDAINTLMIALGLIHVNENRV